MTNGEYTLRTNDSVPARAPAGEPLRGGGSPLGTEWAAVRQGCGLLDAQFRALWRVGGADRTTFLQGMLTNDVVRLHPGQGTYAALLTIQGRVVSDLRVYILEEEIWLDVPSVRAATVRETLERYIIADDVEFVDEPDGWAPLLALEGPQAARVVLAVTGAVVEGSVPFAHTAAPLGGAVVRLAAASHAGEAGFIVFGGRALQADVWARCAGAGALPVGMDTLDVLRLEAGIPWVGRDFDESTLISEAGLEQAISFEKGCYLGQEVVERVAARGQVQRKLVGLAGRGDRVPRPGTPLMRDGSDVGWITSAGRSPALQRLIALGYVRRGVWEVGTQVRAALAEPVDLEIVPTPFYTR